MTGTPPLRLSLPEWELPPTILYGLSLHQVMPLSFAPDCMYIMVYRKYDYIRDSRFSN